MIRTREKLAEYLTVIMFTTSAQHAAVNFGQVGISGKSVLSGQGGAPSRARSEKCSLVEVQTLLFFLLVQITAEVSTNHHEPCGN